MAEDEETATIMRKALIGAIVFLVVMYFAILVIEPLVYTEDYRGQRYQCSTSSVANLSVYTNFPRFIGCFDESIVDLYNVTGDEDDLDS